MSQRPTLPEPIEWRLWKNRQRRDAIVVSLSTYEGRNLIGVRLHTTGTDGKMRPTGKGISMDIARLDELHTAVTRAIRRARVLGLIDGNETQPDDDGAGE
jgi:Transcriptional Coactivator p15 (PC4)